jgi:hypothetical protein
MPGYILIPTQPEDPLQDPSTADLLAEMVLLLQSAIPEPRDAFLSLLVIGIVKLKMWSVSANALPLVQRNVGQKESERRPIFDGVRPVGNYVVDIGIAIGLDLWLERRTIKRKPI